MTKIRQPNPIFDRALQHSRWPSPRTTWILFGVFILVGLVYIWFVYLVDRDDTLAISISLIVFGLSSLLVAILSAPLSALVTCLNLPKEISGDAFQTLRLTGLSRRKIVVGYLLISLYRLRLLWVLTFGMLFVLAFLLAKSLSLYDALFATITGGVIGTALNWLAICTGLWASVRWGKRWIALMVTLAITGVALLLSLGGILGMLFDFFYIDQWWVIPVLTFLILIAPSLYLLHQAEQQI